MKHIFLTHLFLLCFAVLGAEEPTNKTLLTLDQQMSLKSAADLINKEFKLQFSRNQQPELTEKELLCALAICSFTYLRPEKEEVANLCRASYETKTLPAGSTFVVYTAEFIGDKEAGEGNLETFFFIYVNMSAAPRVVQHRIADEKEIKLSAHIPIRLNPGKSDHSKVSDDREGHMSPGKKGGAK